MLLSVALATHSLIESVDWWQHSPVLVNGLEEQHRACLVDSSHETEQMGERVWLMKQKA